MGKWAERMAIYLHDARPNVAARSSEPFEGADVEGRRDSSLPPARSPRVPESMAATGEEFLHPSTGLPSKPSKVTFDPFEGAEVVGGCESEVPAVLNAHAREAMHRLGYCDGEAEAQLQSVLETVPAATVIADLQAIGDERGLPPTEDPVQELHTEHLKRRGLPPAVIAELAPRLAKRDRDGVDLRSCAECARFARIGASHGRVVWFCQHPSPMIKHGCHGPDVMFRCEGFHGCR